ncbi:MAG: outer membrane beta-barrel protein [Alistipes sp.]|nr:outer membrane beta-barrel protein [Alistipes sp.]
MKSGLKALTAILAAMFCIAPVQAQHTLGIVGGGGMTTARLYPSQETRGIWGVMSGGISWRYYSAPRFVGCIGLDLEFMQRGFSYAPDASRHDEDKQYHYYTRMYDALSLPVVWQPHVYLFKNHLRVYLEAALNLELNLSSRFEYKLHTGEVESGVYQIKNYRDNRFGYGLCGGGGIDAIFGRFELGVRVRYYFGLSDIMKNRNKYYDNGTDNSYVNPFTLTPLRSPVDNLMFSVKLGFRFNRNGFDEWYMKRPKRDKKAQTFNFSLD